MNFNDVLAKYTYDSLKTFAWIYAAVHSSVGF